MAIKQQLIHPFGMKQDNIINSKDNSSTYAVDIRNLRFNTIDDLTTGVWTTEKGNVNVPLHIIEGLEEEKYNELNTILHKLKDTIIIGSAVINEQWILFGMLQSKKFTRDFILKLWYVNNDLYVDLLYSGNLNFNVEHPLETMVYYENEEIQKVYWTDNFNQPRFINVVNVKHWHNFDDQFDFVKKVSLDEQVYIWKESGQNGIWNAGTVKYALTYFNKYGQESNIIWTSTLMYPLVADRGCDSDEISGDMMHIMVNVWNNYGSGNMLESWDCLRLYSIYRSSEGAKPIVKIVEDKELNKDTIWYHFTDTNTTGTVVDSDRLMFVGGKEILCETFNQKDGTMFMGNITLKKRSIEQLLKDYGVEDNDDWFVDGETTGFVGGQEGKVIATCNLIDNGHLTGSHYIWDNQLNYKEYKGVSSDGIEYYDTINPKIFKYKEWYRFGIQFQDNCGNWSEVHHLVDVVNDIMPIDTSDPNGILTTTGKFKYVLPNAIRLALIANGYKKARLVYCPPTNANRRVLAQGLISLTMSNNKWKREKTLDYFHSYFYRYDDHDNTMYGNGFYYNNGNPGIGQYEIQSCVPTYCLFSGQNNELMVPMASTLSGGSPSYLSYYWPASAPRLQNSTGDTGGVGTHTTDLRFLLGGASGENEINRLLDLVKDTSTNSYKTDTFVKRLVDIYSKFNNSEFHTENKVLTLHSPDIEFDDSIRTLDYTNVLFRKVGYSVKSSRVGWMYLDFAKQAMDYLGNKGEGLKRMNINVFHGSYPTGDESWFDNKLGVWNDIDVYNANSVSKDYDEGEGINDNKTVEPRYQNEYIKHDYFIYPFQRKYLNNYMGDLSIQMYMKGTDPEYSVVESSIINEKVVAYKRCGYKTAYDINPVEFERSSSAENQLYDIQIYDAIGDSILRLSNGSNNEFITYSGNMNTIAPLCNYKDIYDALYDNKTWDNLGNIIDVDPDIIFVHDDDNHPDLERHNGVGPFYSMICFLDKNFNISLYPPKLLYQPIFETPIFKYQGINIVSDFSTFYYNNVNTNWGDNWRNNWTWDDWASLATGVGWIAALINNIGETTSQDDNYTFVPLQKSEIIGLSVSQRIARFFNNLLFGNFTGLIQDFINFSKDHQDAIIINRYKGAYPIATVLDNRLKYREKYGATDMTMPKYLMGDYNISTDKNQSNPSYWQKRLARFVNGQNDTDGESSWKDIYKYIRKRDCWPVGVSSDPVKFSYKTTPHAVISTNGMMVNQWQIGELYREITLPNDYNTTLTDPSFGNIELTAYIPCSKSFALENNGGDLVLYHDEGDYYYMRYDNLRTYPYEEHPVNGVVDIMSYMVETRINLDGRCDKYRKQTDNTLATRSNYNVVNKAYTQSDNYFTYFCIDDLSKRLDKFKNMITWSKTKINGDLIDTWTNVTMVNTDDADGSCGAITKIVNINNNLLALQEHALVQLGYNEKTAISTENGVPLEMANSGKFTGFNYISKDYGCQNKWSVNNNNLGLWFIDDSRREILQFSSGEGIMSLSKNAGFDSFMIEQLTNADKSWKPSNFNNFITFYDKLSKDLYYLNNKKCLTYNETSHTFTSFYEYYGVPAMANLSDHFLMWGGIRGANTEETEVVVRAEEPAEEQTSLTKLVTILGVTDINAPVPTPIMYAENNPNATHIPINNPYGGTIKIPVSGSTNQLNGKFINISLPVDTIADDGLSINDYPYRINGNYAIKLKWKVSENSTIVDKWIQFNLLLDAELLDNSTNLNSYVSEITTSDNLHIEENDIKVMAFVHDHNGGPAYEGIVNILIGNCTFNRDTFEANPNQVWNGAVTHTVDNSSCIVTIDLYTHNSTDYLYTNPLSIDYSNGCGQIFVDDAIKSGDVNVSIVDNIPVSGNTVTETIIDPTPLQSGIWATRENVEYSKFFNEYYPYWITLMSDGGNELRMFDKVFNTIEYRADLYDDNTLVDNYGINAYLFTDIAAWNGYQFYKEFDILDKETTLAFPFERKLSDRYEWQSERKFNVWRTILPRATYKDGNEFVTSRDRIRNPFTFIKLVNNHPEFNRMPDGVGSHRMVLHDFTVNFDVR